MNIEKEKEKVVCQMDKTIEEIKVIKKKFQKEHNPMDYANGCGIGVPYIDKQYEIGISLMFETKEDMENFPYKESTYEGIPVYKRVVGIIRAL